MKLLESDKRYLEEPDKYVLVKAKYNDLEFYDIITLGSPLMIKICDDLDYALLLANRMIERGVKVFDNSESFKQWREDMGYF